MLTQTPTIQRMLLTMAFASHAKAANPSTQECFERAKSSVYAHQVAEDDLDECLSQIDLCAQIETEELKSQDLSSSSGVLIINKDAKLSHPFDALQSEPASNIVGHLNAGGAVVSHDSNELAGAIVKRLVKRWTLVEDMRVLSNAEQSSGHGSCDESESENDTSIRGSKDTPSGADSWEESSLDSNDDEPQSKTRENRHLRSFNDKDEEDILSPRMQPQHRDSFAPQRPIQPKETFPASSKRSMEDNVAPELRSNSFQRSSPLLRSHMTSSTRPPSQFLPKSRPNMETHPEMATQSSSESRAAASSQNPFNGNSMPPSRPHMRANTSPLPSQPPETGMRTGEEDSSSIDKSDQEVWDPDWFQHTLFAVPANLGKNQSKSRGKGVLYFTIVRPNWKCRLVSGNAVLFRPLLPDRRQQGPPYDISLFRSFNSLSSRDRIRDGIGFLIVRLFLVPNPAKTLIVPITRSLSQKGITFGVPFREYTNMRSSSRPGKYMFNCGMDKHLQTISEFLMDLADDSETNFPELVNSVDRPTSARDFRKLGQELLEAVQNESMNIYVVYKPKLTTGATSHSSSTMYNLNIKDWKRPMPDSPWDRFQVRRDHIEIRLVWKF